MLTPELPHVGVGILLLSVHGSTVNVHYQTALLGSALVWHLNSKAHPSALFIKVMSGCSLCDAVRIKGFTAGGAEDKSR